MTVCCKHTADADVGASMICLVAASVADDISSFMQRAAALSTEQDEAEQQTDAADEAPDGKRSRKSAGCGARATQQGCVPMDMLKQLQSSLAAGKQAGILLQLDQEQLRQLLLLLLDHVRLGQDQLLDEQDTVSNPTVCTGLLHLQPAAQPMTICVNARLASQQSCSV
jgi:hypothetical protein